MPIYFQFTPDDETIWTDRGLAQASNSGIRILTANDRANVPKDGWQQDDSYEFTFHDGHDKGWPLYVTARRGKSMSKVNLNPESEHGFIDNGSVKGAALDDAQNVIAKSWDLLVKLGQHYYAA